jgi:hypothetical protein
MNSNSKVIPGTINLQGSSYSGADIKIMILSRNADLLKKTYEQQLAALDAEGAALETELRALTAGYDHLVMTPAEAAAVRDASGETKLQHEQELFETVYTEERAYLQEKINSINKDSQGLITLATVSHLSVDSFRAKTPVRACGKIAPVGYVRGQRSIAGSMVMVQFDEHALASLLYAPPSKWFYEKTATKLINVDQLPPMTLIAQFANEYGSLSEMTVYGVEFVTDSLVLSIEDMFTENTMSYVARDYNVMLKRGDFKLSGGGGSDIQQGTASLLVQEYGNNMKKMEAELGVLRRNPFR